MPSNLQCSYYNILSAFTSRNVLIFILAKKKIGAIIYSEQLACELVDGESGRVLICWKSV